MKVLPYQLKRQINEIKKDYFYPSLQSLNGNILEIGFGKEENFNYYSDNSTVYAIENKNKFLTIENRNNNVILKKGTVEQLPFENDVFDAVVFSFLLCSVNSVESSIQEIKRVLKKDGKIILLEHIKSNSKMTYAVQKLISGFQTLFVNCHLTRDPRIVLKQNFNITNEKIFNNSLEPYLYMELIKQ